MSQRTRDILLGFLLGILAFMAILAILTLTGCNEGTATDGGVQKQNIKVAVGSDGMTTEQRNVAKRLKEDNAPGAIKHLYILSAYSGEVIMYSTVDGKVTSSGKRLQPGSLTGAGDWGSSYYEVRINGGTKDTPEVIGDDGTYGDSVPYLYWWDARGTYHQQYIQGGMILHISSKPLRVNKVAINLDQQ